MIFFCYQQLHGAEVGAQLGFNLRCEMCGRELECHLLEVSPHFHHLDDLCPRKLGNSGAAVRHANYKPEVFQLQKGFAHWNLTYVELLRDVRLAQRSTWREVPGPDCLAQLLKDLARFAKRANGGKFSSHHALILSDAEIQEQ